ncbi:hypothetical protein GCM10011519_11320 [Marmoricola endophyticus]|uniref:Uncharacterized protein n=1 Tax=Marmoricola endophyticus TaxID=2040280 RepID=A0A917F0A9_9ACTN|nr:hypothetical protein [Marmoricola endophyticus]GGF39442.1 hypothetical protein GCM10011519_11320 [Marmoricola endophyticus]
MVGYEQRWVSLVLESGSDVRHGRDPENLGRTLCGTVEAVPTTVMRAPFDGTEADACAECADAVRRPR